MEKYLDNEIELIEFLEKYKNIELLAEGLRNEASLNQINELVELVNEAIHYINRVKDK